MYLVRSHRTIPRLKFLAVRHNSQAALQEQNEYTDKPEYPEILDMSLEARKRRSREEVYEKIRKVKTVEEKQIALNMPRYYGWKCVLFHEDKIPYNALPLVQSYTRSHFIPMEKLPDAYTETEGIADLVVKEIKSVVEDAIAFEFCGLEHTINTTLAKPESTQIEDAKSKSIVKQINRIISNNLSDKVAHILSAQVDYDPRHEAFWFIGGVDVPSRVVKWRKQYPWLKERLHENIDRSIQYLGNPMLAMRSRHPLRPLIPYSEAVNPDFKVPMFTFDPHSVGYFTEYRHGTNIPGHWPGDHDGFGLISYHGRGHLLTRKESYGPEDSIEALHCQALKASFGWLLAQANYQGFTPYNDITYPLATQTIITNGKLWSFYCYQLNTIEMHNERVYENPKHNVCFGTKPLQMFETIENGQVKGLNEDVLKMLVQIYLNSPEERDYKMTPYLGENELVAADIDDDNRRCWIESTYKHIEANKPKHLLPPEIYLWEKIYKINVNTRFFERKVRPFERGINPYHRRLDEHVPPYIPKQLRPYPKARKKFETTYYPDV